MDRRQFLKGIGMAAVSLEAGALLAACSGRHGSAEGVMPARSLAGEVPEGIDAAAVMAAIPGKVGCVGCGRCVPCRFGVDIPGSFAQWNDALDRGLVASASGVPSREDASRYLRHLEETVPDRHLAIRCVGCHACEKACPRQLPIVDHLNAIGRYIDLVRETECRL